MSVLDSELGLTERDWEVTQRENWEPYEDMSQPRFHLYRQDLRRVQEESARSFIDDSDCLLPRSFVQKFNKDNIALVRKICQYEINTIFWKRFCKFSKFPKSTVKFTDLISSQFKHYWLKSAKYYGLIPFTSHKQISVYSELHHYLLHISWDEQPNETRTYHDNKTIAILYHSVVLLMIAEKLNTTEEAALDKLNPKHYFK